MLLDRGERLEWFDSAEIWAEAIASVLGFYLYFVHVLTMEVHFLDKALFRDRNFVLSAIMYFAFGFVLLPTIALTSPMLDEILNDPADTTGYMAIPRSIALVGALIVTARIVPARTDNRPLLTGGMALVVYANWRMLGYSPEMDWRAVVLAGAVQGAGLGILLPTLTKTAFSTLDPAFRPEGTAFFNLSRLYGSSIGVALVLFFYDNTQAMHLALAKDLTPYRAAAHVAGSIAAPKLAMLNDAITGQAAFVGVIGQFEVMMIAMLIVSPLVLFLRKPLPVS
jgi:MFS transporter, DHA2 family, multidrug resistance protein